MTKDEFIGIINETVIYN